MTKYKGFGNLQSPSDLLKKMEHDLSRMKDDPMNAYAAFDFFVTAEHIVDWLYPDKKPHDKVQKKNRDDVRHHHLLEVVSHIANGSKHFQALANHHRSVKGVEQNSGGFHPSAFSTTSFDPGAFKFSGLMVETEDSKIEHATALASKVFEYWEKKLKSD